MDSETGRAAFRQMVERVGVMEDRLSARIDLGGVDIGEIGDAHHAVPSFTIVEPVALARRGVEIRAVLQGAAADARSPDAALIGAIVQASVRFTAWRDPGASATISEIAARHGADASDASRELRPAFPTPDLVELILDGRRSTGLTTDRPKRIGDLPRLWDERRDALSRARPEASLRKSDVLAGGGSAIMSDTWPHDCARTMGAPSNLVWRCAEPFAWETRRPAEMPALLPGFR